MFHTWRQKQKLSRMRAAAKQDKARRRAKQQRRMTMEALEDRSLMAVTTTGIPNWQEQGPGTITHGQVVIGEDFLNDDFVAGAINTILVDPQDASRVIVGTVNGGIWKTTTALSTNPVWTPKTDQFASLAITTIVRSPVDANVLYAGTGSSSSSGIAGAAGGLLKSIDGGEHWTRYGEKRFAGLSIQSIVPTAENGGKVVFLATNSFVPGDAAKRVPHKGGIYRSDDGGNIWKRISGTAGLPDGGVTDFVAHPTIPNRLYAAISGDFDTNKDKKDNDLLPWSNKGIYESNDNGLTWHSVNVGLNLPEDTDGKDNDGDGLTDAQDPREGVQMTRRIKLAIAKTAPNPIYAAFLSPKTSDGFELGVVHRGEYQGDQLTWTSRGRPGTWESVSKDFDKDGDIDPNERNIQTFFGIHPGGQANVHFAFAVHPTDPNVIFIGGDREPGTDDGVSFPNQDGSRNYTGRIFRGTLTPGTEPGWEAVVANGANGTSPHADSRAMVFDRQDGQGDLLVADDGGIYRLSKPDVLGQRRWSSVNGNLAPTELYSVAYDVGRDVIIGGTQDVGNAVQTTAGSRTWRGIAQGDGGIVQIDNTNPAAPIYYFSGPGLGRFKRLTVDGIDQNGGGADWSDPSEWVSIGLKIKDALGQVLPGVTLTGKGGMKTSEGWKVFDNSIQFIQPWVLNAVNPARMLIGTNYIYESFDRGETLEVIGEGILGGIMQISGFHQPWPTAGARRARTTQTSPTSAPAGSTLRGRRSSRRGSTSAPRRKVLSN
jgi:hypothetical protein